jgi:tetratricopeptide (TPR) repeat protein
MSPSIFISYRREDTAGYTRALFNALRERFGAGVFMDVDTLAPGEDFVDAIERAVGSCQALIAVIGAHWAVDKDGRRRFDESNDYVRLEVESALRRDILVVPVLVESTPMPPESELPESLGPLLRRNALNLSNARFAEDVERLAVALESVTGTPSGPTLLDGSVKPAPRRGLWIGVLGVAGLAGVAAGGVWLAQRLPGAEPGAETRAGNQVVVGGDVQAEDGGVVVVSTGEVTVNQRDPQLEQILQVLQEKVESQGRMISVNQSVQLSTRRRANVAEQQLGELRQAVVSLMERREDDSLPDELRAAVAEALGGLEQGETRPAESVFAAFESRAEGASNNFLAAEAARHRGALAFLHDTEAALAAYRRATELDPGTATGWNGLGHVLLRLGRFDDAAAAYRKVVEIGEQTDDRITHAAGLGNLGNVQEALGALPEASEFYHRALDVALVSGDPEGLAHAYNNLGSVYREQGDLRQAEDMYLRAMQFYTDLGDKEGLANTFANLGSVHLMRGELLEAEDKYQQALGISEDLGHLEAAANAYGNLGLVYRESGDLDLSEAMHRKSLEVEEAIGHKAGMASDYGNLATVHLMRGELDQAEEMSRQALALEEDLGRQGGIAEGYSRLGLIQYLRENFDQAEALHRQSLDINQSLDNVPAIARDHVNLGVVYQGRGDASQAAQAFCEAIAIYRSLGAETEVEEVGARLRELGESDC